MKYNFIVDSHCHLDLIEEKGGDIDDIVANAVKNEVKFMQTICTRVSKFDHIYQYALKYPNVFASVGLHPNNVDEEPEVTTEELVRICNENEKVIGIGETGLDYYYDYSKKENQIESFVKHIKAAQETALPLIIHTRDADDDMIRILREQKEIGDFKILLHCFSSSKRLAIEALKLGAYISISGITTFKNATELQDIVKEVPMDQIIVETDAPYLAPVPHRGKMNEPAFTRNVAEFVADLKGISFEEVAEITSGNFFKLFDKAKI